MNMKMSIRVLCLCLCLCLLTGCGSTLSRQDWQQRPVQSPENQYRSYYEVFVYSFQDSNGDGVGDLAGLTQKLDYIADLGFQGIWLMPIMPSPTYHKYDTKDYLAIDPEYGTMEDFDAFLAACQDRDLRVILDLALNHTSVEHPWFQQAAAYLQQLSPEAEPSPAECPYVDYYNFSREAASGWSQVPGTTDWYYESRFWSGMPDLNLLNPALRQEFQTIADFWLDKGVSGFRLDAVKEYVSGLVDSNVEILSWFNDYVKAGHPDAWLVCECWEPKETYAQYYASGVDSMFNFAFADSSGIIAKTLKGNLPASAYGEQLELGQALYSSYSEAFVDAPFYTNHDMGRSAGYYAGEQSAAQTKMAQALNLLMAGNVFLYYGEELGMKGSGIDENKRAPMFWSQDKTAPGMCRGPKAMEKVTMKFGSLEEQAADPDSVYNYIRQVLLLRNQNPVIARGTTVNCPELSGQQLSVIARQYQDREVLMIFNISGETAAVDLGSRMVQGKPVQELDVLGVLLTGEEEAAWKGTTLTVPAYGIVVLGVN